MDVGSQFATWFFWGFVAQTAMLVFPVIQLISKPLASLLTLPFCGVVIGNLVWYIWGMFLKWGSNGQACVENGYLLSANTLTSFFYGITLSFVGFVCALFCCYICFALFFAKKVDDGFKLK